MKDSIIGVVCYGNILRSQALSTFLRTGIAEQGYDYQVIDAGVCLNPNEAFANATASLLEVEEQLRMRGFDVSLYQTTWNDEMAKALSTCDLIVAADEEVKQALEARLPSPCPSVYGFYELIGEADREFVDTYDYERHEQKPDTFTARLDELQRIANQMLELLPKYVDRAS